VCASHTREMGRYLVYLEKNEVILTSNLHMHVRVRMWERELDSVWVFCTLGKLAQFCVCTREIGRILAIWDE